MQKQADIGKETSVPRQKDGAASETTVLQDVLYLLAKIAVLLVVSTLVLTFLYGVIRTTDDAMAPAIREGDLTLFFRLDRDYAPGDVIVLSFEGETQMRRVVAEAGDTVDITERGLMVNGAYIQEQDIYERTYRHEEGIEMPLTVGEGQVFVLADARARATDSRIYGAVEVENTMGKVITILRRRSI